MSTSTHVGSRRPLIPPPAGPPVLTGESGGVWFRFELAPGNHVLGRGEDCEYVLADATISRHHAEVEVADQDVWIRDLKSLNGTFIDRVRVSGRVRLPRGGCARFGHISLFLEDASRNPPVPVNEEDTASETLATSLGEIREHLGMDGSERVLSFLAEAGEVFSRRVPREVLLELFFDFLDRHITNHRILILQPHPDPPGYVVLASRSRETDADHPMRMSRNLLRKILDEGRAILISNDSGSANRGASESALMQGVRSAMGAPLADNDEIHGVVYLEIRKPGLVYRSEDLQLLTLLAHMVAVKLTNLRLEDKERALQRLRHELVTASRIQRNLLPGSFPELEEFETFAYLDPCEEIGGDFYDVRTCRDGRLWITLGDVTGHGITAALLMSHVMSGLQILEDGCCNPQHMLEQLEAYLIQHLEEEQFVALFTGLLDPGTGRLEYVNAGQPPPALITGGGVQWLANTGPPVALIRGGAERSKASCVVGPGDILLAYSDGVSEIRNGAEEYGDIRLPAYLAGAHGLSAEALIRGLLDDVREYRNRHPLRDDLTVMAIRRT